jgi:hypothetical protein
MKKGIVIGIILLCVITSTTSSLDCIIVKASEDKNFVEVTSQIYGVTEHIDTTVKLSKSQYQNLRYYLTTLQSGLNQTTTRDGLLILLKEAITELGMCGLLPKGMTIHQILSLVAGERFGLMTQNFLKMNLKSHLIHSNILSIFLINLFCFFYAHTSLAFEDNIWELLAFLFDIKGFYLLGSLLLKYSQVKPFRFMNRIWVIGPGIGGYTYDYYTIGLRGIQKGGNDFNMAYGFSGIKLILDDPLEAVYIGFTVFATHVTHQSNQ